jgi:RNA polymerase sigma factor (sigma-70 family)
LIEKEMRMNVVGEAEDGKEAILLARKLKPEIVIMDLSMPDMNGIEATKRILKEFSETKVIALSMYSEKRYVVDMFRAGAYAYLLKDCAFEQLEEAIKAVADGRKFISPDLADVVLDDYVEKLQNSDDHLLATLSERERLIVVRYAEGWTTKEIADGLNVSTKTVDSHRQRVMEKLNITSIAELVKYAIREGLTTLET